MADAPAVRRPRRAVGIDSAHEFGRAADEWGAGSPAEVWRGVADDPLQHDGVEVDRAHVVYVYVMSTAGAFLSDFASEHLVSSRG